MTDVLGKTTTFGYDAFGDMTSESSPTGVTTGYTYDSNGDQTGTFYVWINPADPSDTQPVPRAPSTTPTATD